MDNTTELPVPNGVPPYTKKDIFRRYDFLADRCKRYLDQLGGIHPAWGLRYDDLVMVSVTQSALDDIWRFKMYHLRDPEKLSDAVKRSAFFTKWLVRFRPIYFNRIQSEARENMTLDKNDTSLMANEGFAIHLSLTTLASEIGVEGIHLDPDFFTAFLYDLHYRKMSQDALLGLYSIIKNAAQGKSVVLKVL